MSIDGNKKPVSLRVAERFFCSSRSMVQAVLSGNLSEDESDGRLADTALVIPDGNSKFLIHDVSLPLG